ncbi:NADAR family protein [Bacteroidales bacterium OttesenSCG-928-L03]|nr:NADAR family protein [Bacteroidales bacterium OttesenSCG-928-L03]
MYNTFSPYLNLERIASVVASGQNILPENESEFTHIGKLGIYPAENCISIIIKKGIPFYLLDNLAVLPSPLVLTHDDQRFSFNQVEQLYLTPRMINPEAHYWLMDNLFKGRGNQKGRVDARLKRLYKIKKSHTERADWKVIQTEWMKAVLSIKYKQCSEFRELLLSTNDKILIEDATQTNYDSNCFWGAKQVSLDGEKVFIGINNMGKVLMELRDNKGNIKYSIPSDLHLFGIPFEEFDTL